ncbi:MAG: hypothetical protein J6P48_05320 [Oscillospiraceae bacterium]|nr:hypothetical protein [Oscillospiraceae bacterium]
MDIQEPACPFDTSAYTGTPDSVPQGTAEDIPALIEELDRLYASEDYPAAEALLRKAKEKTVLGNDWRSRLSIVSEELGLTRKMMKEAEALAAIDEARKLIQEHGMGRTVSGATVLLNAATTLKCFGRAEESEPLFEHVARVYTDNLDCRDYRFAGLYNNMALTFEDLGRFGKAERCFALALDTLEYCDNSFCDKAVTWVNLAECYDRQDCEDERIAECMERAGECLLSPEVPLDGYYTFTVGKCLPAFERFGFFTYTAQLKKRMEEINGLS